jgi:hypothetical protein
MISVAGVNGARRFFPLAPVGYRGDTTKTSSFVIPAQAHCCPE